MNFNAPLVGAAAAALFAVYAAASCAHTVAEGHIGLYWRGGALLDRITEPGFHTHMPLVERFEQVQVSLQTDSVRDIPCGTSDGLVVTFSKIEVVNQLDRRLAWETVKNYTTECASARARPRARARAPNTPSRRQTTRRGSSTRCTTR